MLKKLKVSETTYLTGAGEPEALLSDPNAKSIFQHNIGYVQTQGFKKKVFGFIH